MHVKNEHTMRSVLVILSPTHAKDRVCETSKKGAATAQYHSFALFFHNFFFLYICSVMLSFDDAYCYICCSSSFYLFQFVHHSLLKRHIRVKSGCFRASCECAPHKSVLSFIPTRRFQSSSNNSYVLSSDSSMRIRILVC